MSVKIKYNQSGFVEAEIDVRSIGSYENDVAIVEKAIKLSANDSTAVVAPSAEKPKKRNKRTKGRPNYATDIDTAAALMEDGCLKYLHGIDIRGEKRTFYFDRVEPVKQVLETIQKDIVTDEGCVQDDNPEVIAVE